MDGKDCCDLIRNSEIIFPILWSNWWITNQAQKGAYNDSACGSSAWERRGPSRFFCSPRADRASLIA